MSLSLSRGRYLPSKASKSTTGATLAATGKSFQSIMFCTTKICKETKIRYCLAYCVSKDRLCNHSSPQLLRTRQNSTGKRVFKISAVPTIARRVKGTMQTSLMPSAGSITYSAITEISSSAGRSGCWWYRRACKVMTVPYRLPRQDLVQC